MCEMYEGILACKMRVSWLAFTEMAVPKSWSEKQHRMWPQGELGFSLEQLLRGRAQECENVEAVVAIYQAAHILADLTTTLKSGEVGESFQLRRPGGLGCPKHCVLRKAYISATLRWNESDLRDDKALVSKRTPELAVHPPYGKAEEIASRDRE